MNDPHAYACQCISACNHPSAKEDLIKVEAREGGSGDITGTAFPCDGTPPTTPERRIVRLHKYI